MFVTQQTKTTSHTIMRCHSGQLLIFLDNYRCQGFFVCHGLIHYFWGYWLFFGPISRNQSHLRPLMIHDLRMSLFCITNHQRFVNTSGPYVFSKRRNAGIPKSSGSPCHPLIFQILGWVDTTLLFWFVTRRPIVPYSVLLNSCSEMQWEARVHKCRRTWNLNEFKLANSFPITIMTLNGVQFQGHGGTHHPAVLSTWIHVKQLHTRTSIRASMSMAPLCICWPRTILWSVSMGRAWQWSVLRLIKWDAQIMATWTMGDCLGPWFDWTENNVFYGLMMIRCTYVYIMNLMQLYIWCAFLHMNLCWWW